MKNIFNVDNEKKNAYLENIKQRNEQATYELYSKLIYKLDEFEDYKGIQATNMTKMDFMEFLTSISSSSLNVLYTYKSAISSYLIFATDKTKFTMGLLELDKISQEDLLECINEKAEEIQFITEKDYYEIITKLDDNGKSIGNYQDKLIILLLWHKIKGERSFDELLGLKKTDVDLINKTIKSNGRTIYLTNDELEVVKKAMKEQMYIRTARDKKGLIVEANVECLDGEYLVKATAGTTNRQVDTNQCSYGTFANRMSKYYNLVLQRSGLTNQRVYKSSVYYHMLKEYGRKLSLSELTEYIKLQNEKIGLSNIYREQEIMYNKMVEQGEI